MEIKLGYKSFIWLWISGLNEGKNDWEFAEKLAAVRKNECNNFRSIQNIFLWYKKQYIYFWICFHSFTEKYKKPTSQITFLAVTIKQWIKKSYDIQHSQCKNEFNVLVQVFPLHGLSTIFPV